MMTHNGFRCSLRMLALVGLAGLVQVMPAADPPPPGYPPVVHLLAVDAEAAEEGSDPALFLVLRVGPTNTPLTVSYVVGGSAENGVDYTPLSGTVTIPAGAFVAPVEVVPLDDFLVEGNETVILALAQPLQWPPPYFVSWPSVAAAFLEDNDAPPTNQPPYVRLVNPPDGAVFTAPVDVPLVARAGDPDGRVVTVEFFANGTSLGVVTNRPPLAWADVLASGSLDALLLDLQAERLPEVDPAPQPRPLPDPLPVPDNLFRLRWVNAPPGTHVLTAVATDNRGATTTSEPITIRILDAPLQPVVHVLATDPVATEPDPAGVRLDSGTFTICRTGPTNFPLVVWYRLSGTASNGVDYRELPTSVTIPEGASRVNVVVAPLADNLVEGEETVVLTIVPPVCIAIYPPPPDCYLVGRPDTATVVIRDSPQPTNQPPVTRLVRPLDGSVFVAPATITLAALAWDADGRVVSVEFFANGTSLGVVPNPLLSTALTPSNALSNATRPLFTLVWSNVPPGHYVLTAVATDNLGARGRSQPVEVKVTPLPVPPTVTVVATDPIATEPGGVLTVIDTATFTVTRTGSTAERLLVQYSLHGTAENGVDYRRLPGQVVIPRGASSATVVVEPLRDDRVEGPESVILRLEPPVCIDIYPPPAECIYRVGEPSVARAIIRDSQALPTNQPPKVAIVRPQEGEVFRAHTDIALYAAAQDADGWVQTVEFFEGNRSLGIVTNQLLDATAVGQPGLTVVEANVDQLFRLVWSAVPPGRYSLTAVATDNHGATTRSAPVHITVLDEALPPVVTIQATDPYAAEGWLRPWPPSLAEGADAGLGGVAPPTVIRPDTATFTVRRSGGTNVPLVVYYSLGGTAENGVDYARLPGQVTIPRGAWSADIVVVPLDDALVEGTETVIARLEPVACPLIWPPPPDCYVLGEPSQATASIADNDFNQSPKVEIVHPPDGAAYAAPATIEINVLALDPDGWVSRVEFYEGTNLIGVEEIHFIVPPPPGQVQRFSLTWSNVAAGSYVLTARGYDNQGARAVSDPIRVRVFEQPLLPVVTVVATDPVGSEIHPALDVIPDPAVFTVYRTGSTARPLRVFYTLAGTATHGRDYEELPGVVEIPAGDAKADIVVRVLDDELVEGTETVVLTLTQLRCVTEVGPPVEGCYLVGQPGRALAYIRDNDALPNQPPTVTLVNPPDGAVFTAPADIRLVASATDPDGWVVSVEFFANNVSLGVVTNRPWIVEPVRFADLQGAVLTDTAPLPVPVRNPFVLLWTNVPAGRYTLTAVATDNLGARARSRPVEIQVRQPSQPPLVRVVALDGFAQEGTGNHAGFLFFLAAPTPVPLTVHYSLSGTAENGVDYQTLPTQITIPAGRAWARLRLVALEDNLPEPVETVIVEVVPSPVDPPAYEIGEPATAGAIIVDANRPRPQSGRLPDGRMHLHLPLPAGVPYRLEASTNLVDWVPVITRAVAEDEVHYVDDGQHGARQRFFRVVPEVEALTTAE